MQYSTTKHVISSVLQWKIRFMQVSTLTWNFRNAVFRLKTRLFVRFTVKNWLCVSANADFKLHERDNLVFFFVKIKTAHVWKKLEKKLVKKIVGVKQYENSSKSAREKENMPVKICVKFHPWKQNRCPWKIQQNLRVKRHKFP